MIFQPSKKSPRATTKSDGLMSSIDKVKLNNTNIAYGTCATAASTAAKVVKITGNENWDLFPGSIITVKFSYTNVASNPTLNVNDKGAMPIIYNTSNISTSNLTYAGSANRYITYVYTGSSFVFIGWSIDNNTWRGIQDNLTSTDTDQSLSAKQGKILKEYIDDIISQLTDISGSSTKLIPTGTIDTEKYILSGQTLSTNHHISGKMTYDGADVPGSFSWLTTDEDFYKYTSGTVAVKWLFTPTDQDKYESVIGTVTLSIIETETGELTSSDRDSVGINEYTTTIVLPAIFVSSAGKVTRINSIASGVFPSSINNIKLPGTIIYLKDAVCQGCANLTCIHIPDSVTSIGANAFYQCSALSSIIIPSSVTSIGDNAFSGCSALTSIIIPSSVTSIGDHAFYQCSAINSVVIESGTIGAFAFNGCGSLTSLTIGIGVTSIGDRAFDDCGTISTIYYRGTAEQWAKINITYIYQDFWGYNHDCNQVFKTATIIYNYKG